MCGITGIWAPGADPALLEERVREAARRLTHRGPDAEGYSFIEGLALGHRRLVVIDKEGGAQPFEDSEGRALCVYNGEIYNHTELRGELETAGEKFGTRSDTEALVRAFAHWGREAFHRLDGMFAAALFHSKNRTLTLVRDGAGEKPLFYFEGTIAGAPGVAFASEVHALLALLDEIPPVEPVALWSYLSLGYARAPRLLRGVKEVPPGSFVEIQNAKARAPVRFWRTAPEPQAIPKEKALPEIRAAVRHAVQGRLESDVPLGAFLSGGLDSSIVVYEMRASGVEDLRTFSIGFSDGEGYDESPYARRVAEFFGTKHREEIVTGDAALMEAALGALDEPMADSSFVAEYALARHARREITVALGGDGSDEVFCGYERLAGIPLTERVPRFLRGSLPAFSALVPDTKGYGNRGERLRRLLNAAPLPAWERLLRWQAFLPPGEAATLLKESLPEDSKFPWPADLSAPAGEALHDALRLNFESYLCDDILVKTDRASMAHGLELRAPFLAREVIALGHSLPKTGLARGTALKRWLREAYAQVLPREVLTRRKHGFGVPVHVWLRESLKEWAEEKLFKKNGPLFDYVSEGQLRALWDAHQAGRANNGPALYALLVLAHWLGKIRP